MAVGGHPAQRACPNGCRSWTEWIAPAAAPGLWGKGRWEGVGRGLLRSPSPAHPCSLPQSMWALHHELLHACTCGSHGRVAVPVMHGNQAPQGCSPGMGPPHAHAVGSELRVRCPAPQSRMHDMPAVWQLIKRSLTCQAMKSELHGPSVCLCCDSSRGCASAGSITMPLTLGITPPLFRHRHISAGAGWGHHLAPRACQPQPPPSML